MFATGTAFTRFACYLRLPAAALATPWAGVVRLEVPADLEIPDAVHKVYPDLSHAEDWEAAIDATSFVPDEVVAQLCGAIGLVGTGEDVAAQIADATKLGARSFYLMPFQTFTPPEAEMRAFRDVVFPRLRAGGFRA